MLSQRATGWLPQVVVINEALARAAFRERDPIGRVIIAGYDSMDPMTIVGVVGDVWQYGSAREPQPEINLPYQQHFYNGATLFVVVRTARDPTALGPSIQRKARERSPEVSVRLTTLNALLAEHVATPKFRAWLLSLFGAVALCLAMAGVYGVMAFVAGQRSKEIAVRMALGAGARSVWWLMLSRGLKITAIGLTAGVLGAIASTRLVSGMLFQVQPHDVVTYAGVVGALGLLSLLATYLPAVEPLRLTPSSRFVRSEANPAPLFGHRARTQAACRSASSRLNHSPMRFQLANVSVISLRSLSQAQASDPTTPVPPASARRLLDLSDGFTMEINPP